ncbi:MAG TPA: PQQ-binding-like beta-propeller repeat protein [Pirellulales bacterium]
MMFGIASRAGRVSGWIAAASFVASLGVAHAEDWPEFRGPTAQGVSSETGLPVEWGPDKNIRWKVQVPGLGWSSPVIVDGKVYLTSADPTPGGAEGDLDLIALCFDAATGKQLWRTNVFKEEAATAPKIHGKNSHASPTPLVRDGKLYVHFGHMGTACLDLEGKVIWKKVVSYQPVHGNGGSPLLIDGKLIFAVDGAVDRCVIALDAASGEQVWRFDRQGDPQKHFAFCTPLAIDVKGKTQIVSPGADYCSGLDPATGQEIWYVKYKGYSIVPRPVFAHGLLFFSTSYDSAKVICVKPDQEGDLTDTNIAWTMTRGAPYNPSMVVVGDELYMVSDGGIASCVDARTGDVHWQERLGNNYSSSLLAAEGRIYFQSEQGPAVVVAASKEFQKLAENDLGERCLSSYGAADKSLFIRTERHLYRVQNRD